MSRKNDILTNLREYSSDQIAEAIMMEWLPCMN